MKMKKKQDQSSMKLRAAGIHGGLHKHKGADPELNPKSIPGKPKTRKGMALAMNDEVRMQIVKDKASGMSYPEIARKYSVGAAYIYDAVRTMFLKSNEAKKILQGILWDNAIMSGMRVRQTIDELQPMQAVIATGIMTQRAVDLEKHMQSSPSDVDFSELAAMGNLLKDLRGHTVLPADKRGDIIDIDADVETE